MKLSQLDRSSIKSSFQKGELLIKSPSVGGEVQWKPITDINVRPNQKSMVRISGGGKQIRVTGDHTCYQFDEVKKKIVGISAENLLPKTKLLTDEGVQEFTTESTVIDKSVYTITVDENYSLYANGIAVSNCPDRRYHLRPPDHGVRIQNFTTRFGYVWESPQLMFCLQMAVGAINLAPPRTFYILDNFCGGQTSPAADWLHLLIMRAAAFAFRIEQTRWIADEFNYSIGSLSLDIQKSDKYSGQADAFEQNFATQLEMAKRTLKYVIGLRMSRFSGVSGLMSFGPSTARQSLVNYPSMMRG